MQLAAELPEQPREISSLNSAEEALGVLARTGAALGLPYALIVSTRHGGPGLIGPRHCVTNLPKVLAEDYLDPARIMDTPFYARFGAALLPARFHVHELRPWGIARDSSAPAVDTASLEGFACPVHAGTGVVNIIALLGRDGARLDPATSNGLHLLSIYMVERVRQLAAPPPMVSRRQLDCMRWIAAGKTSQEIAELLDISEHTVNHHIAAACARLGAATRAQALVKLMRMNAL